MKKLWIISLLALAGCGVRDDIAKPVEDYTVKEVNKGVSREATIISDTKHDCEYVVIKSAVFCWRGTNLIAYTTSQHE